ncbi:hypothetical protein H0H81_009287 [Sphagnurus paluster]|uniref:Pentatricopeptide repeat-containing protein n=1 Tax=Sphagnurus paluster TaxID=117069 RepID=A0A9P7GR93_9AGAR|nr:hypothetical protein H0H81_009287 [Sphagnurus paluster]
MLSRHAARAYSTHSRPLRSARFVDALLRETREPVWRLVTALNTPRSVDLPAALSRHGVSVDQFRHWRPLVVESNLSDAVGLVQRNGVQKLPSWLLLYLVAFKIRTHDNAFPVAVDLTNTHLPSAPISVQGPLLILTLLALARFSLLVPMRQIVDTFLRTNLDHPQLYFNLLLQALACTPARSVDTANTAVTLLKAMDARQLKLTHTTYDALLNDRFVTLQLTKFLRERMTREGIVPTAAQLEAYLRVFAQNGSIHTAQEYLRAIHERAPEAEDPSQDPRHRANTLFLAAHNDRASAFNFLRTLLDTSSETSTAIRPDSAPQSLVPPTKLPSSTRKKSSKTSPPNYPTKPNFSTSRLPSIKPDIYSYTSALAVAARDHTLPASHLLALFQRMLSSTSLAPTIATHTVLIRGLLRRKSPRIALSCWYRLRATGLPLDAEALAAGLQVLTRAGLPHHAWALLEEEMHAAGKGKGGEVFTTIALNEWLVALNRTARPDVVFALWDAAPVLYGVQPDTRTLSILLQSARLARRLDGESVAGAVMRLKLEFGRNPFRSHTSTDVDDDLAHEDAVKANLAKVLGPASLPSPHAYKPALWHGCLPHEYARRVFVQALFDAAPDAQRLRAVEPPARALATETEPELGMLGLWVGLPPWRAKEAAHSQDDEALLPAPARTMRYPAIVPTNETCFNYIALLGVLGRGREVARVLGWMRELGIMPGRQTLGIAVVLWREVTGRAVLVERWTGQEGAGVRLDTAEPDEVKQEGEGGRDKDAKRRERGEALEKWAARECTGEYGRLVAWLADWVGVWRLPGPRALAVWSRNLARLREGGRVGRDVTEDAEVEVDGESEEEGKEDGLEGEEEPDAALDGGVGKPNGWAVKL